MGAWPSLVAQLGNPEHKLMNKIMIMAVKSGVWEVVCLPREVGPNALFCSNEISYQGEVGGLP